jgi:uracil-DNA glycosylase
MPDPATFARVIACTRCTTDTDRHLDRCARNVPQPGFIGSNYSATGVLLVGQNPAQAKTLAERDEPYMAALRRLGAEPTSESLAAYEATVRDYVEEWPITQAYFPLVECGLTIDDIAYCNLVRCRTTRDAAPGPRLVGSCVATHFELWLERLAPRIVVFIGKWAAERGAAACERRGIPYTWVTRQRSLPGQDRARNRAEVAARVKEALTFRRAH